MRPKSYNAKPMKQNLKMLSDWHVQVFQSPSLNIYKEKEEKVDVQENLKSSFLDVN